MKALFLFVALLFTSPTTAASETSVVGDWIVLENISDNAYEMSFGADSTVHVSFQGEVSTGEYEFTSKGAYGEMTLMWPNGSNSRIWVQFFNDGSMVFYDRGQETEPNLETAFKLSRLRKK